MYNVNRLLRFYKIMILVKTASTQGPSLVVSEEWLCCVTIMDVLLSVNKNGTRKINDRNRRVLTLRQIIAGTCLSIVI